MSLVGILAAYAGFLISYSKRISVAFPAAAAAAAEEGSCLWLYLLAPITSLWR